MASIVIADDEFLLADMLGMLLEEEGHEVSTAIDGEEALRLVREIRPALLITDFMMPKMTGLELAEVLRADSAIEPMPIILVSGAQGVLARARPELFDAIFDKPYDNGEMLKVIARLV